VGNIVALNVFNFLDYSGTISVVVLSGSSMWLNRERRPLNFSWNAWAVFATRNFRRGAPAGWPHGSTEGREGRSMAVGALVIVGSWCRRDQAWKMNERSAVGPFLRRCRPTSPRRVSPSLTGRCRSSAPVATSRLLSNDVKQLRSVLLYCSHTGRLLQHLF